MAPEKQAQSSSQQAVNQIFKMGLSVAKEKLYEPIPAFIELYNSPVGQYLKKFDKSKDGGIIPLSVAGHFLDYVGNKMIAVAKRYH